MTFRVIALAVSTMLTLSAVARSFNAIDTHASSLRAAQQMQRHLAMNHSWHSDHSKTGSALSRTIGTDDYDNIIPSIADWGTLYAPNGESWLYTSNIDYDNLGSISGADFTIYDAQMQVYKQLSINLQLGPNETSINIVQMAPQLSRKFFNIDDAYEVMVYVHATTADYTGHSYTQAYSLKDGSLLGTYEGNMVGCIDNAVDQWSEKMTMAFMRDVYTDVDSYHVCFDIYTPASWGESKANLAHTFDIDYSLFAGAENYAMPLLMNRHAGQVYFALPRYEKPYFKEAAYWEEPEINPDNNFIIDLYNSDFELVSTTSIPMWLNANALYTFPGIGIMQGNDDLSWGIFTEADQVAYVVGIENYVAGSDDFTYDLYVYDASGNRLETIVEGASDFMRLYGIEGYQDQYCFLYDGESPLFSMVDFPSLSIAAEINLFLPDGNNITTAFDRTPAQGSYKYVSTLPIADVDENDNALHCFAWFDADGSFDRYDRINLGKDIATASPYISGEAFYPYFFNTDSHIEYMLLVKEYVSDQGSATRQMLKVYSDNSEPVLSIGPDDATGEVIMNVFLYNVSSATPKLMVGYMNTSNYIYSLRSFDLPFEPFAGGDGSAEAPYQISQPGDLMAIHLHPAAHYLLTADLDCEQVAMVANPCTFTGVLDGAGHIIYDMDLNGALFESLGDNAIIKDLVILDSRLHCDGIDGGFIAQYAAGQTQERHVTLSNIHVYNSSISGSNSTAGALIGTSVVYTAVEGCSAQDLDIALDGYSVAGGLIGRMQTSASVKASAFKGSISAEIAGGIAGVTATGDESITDCHIIAQIYGSQCCGGIVGEAARSIVHHCYAQVSIDGGKYAAGLIGILNPSYENSSNKIISNNIAALDELNANVDDAIFHRIIGLSSGETYEIDWNNVTPDMEPADYPRILGEAERGLADNYAMYLAPIVVDMVGADNVEGADLSETEFTETFLASQAWNLGTSLDSPWIFDAKGLRLYLEGDNPQPPSLAPAIQGSVPSTLSYEEHMLVTSMSEIRLFNVSGTLVATGNHSIDTTDLPSGVYLATDGTSTLKLLKH